MTLSTPRPETAHVLRVVGAREHNLRNVTVDIPRSALTVITGPSGSGKSSLAMDTIHAEGQRRYVESMSTFARQILGPAPKPDVDRVEGLSPTIAIEQRRSDAGPRSTVATATEVYDFMRVLFARVGDPRCPVCDRPIVRHTVTQIVDSICGRPAGRRLMILAPLVVAKRGGHRPLLDRLVREGFVRVRIDGTVIALEGLAPLATKEPHTIDAVIDRLTVQGGMTQRVSESVELAARMSGGQVVVAEESGTGEGRDQRYSLDLRCPDHLDVRLEEPTPATFSFNAPQGACPDCHGLGITLSFDPDLVVPDRLCSLVDGAIVAWKALGPRRKASFDRMLRQFCEGYRILPNLSVRDLPPEVSRILMEGSSPDDARRYGVSFEGVLPHLRRLWLTTESDALKQRLHAFLDESACPTCGGTRLKREALCVRIKGRHIAEVTSLTVIGAREFFSGLDLPGERALIAAPLVREILHRLTFLEKVGVEYLTLDRASVTLSGGEWQRIRLATQIGTGLSGVCYVLDEPTVGLHSRDTHRLISILRTLIELDNTVIVVEHDDAVIRASDQVIDVGPGAGASGGRIIVAGSVETVLNCPESVTGRYLAGRMRPPLIEQRAGPTTSDFLELHDVTAHNLKVDRVRIPMGRLVCVTGVSGSGKSTLVSLVLHRALRRRITGAGPRPGSFGRLVGADSVNAVVEVDASPIGRSSRGNPATHVGAMGVIRELFSKTRDAQVRGYGPARFSFNVKGGRCEACEGRGTRRIALHFLPDVLVPCGTCGGRRYNRETLEVHFRGRSVADVLDLRVDEAAGLFENVPAILRKLQSLQDVGLGYLALGQPTNTLSGGEAQRIKLATYLQKVSPPGTLFILDEPTTGLHVSDVEQLLRVLRRLVEAGHGVVCVEHNLDVISAADWIIDLGPEGGPGGGRIVVEGTPEVVVRCDASHTGRSLRAWLNRTR